MPKLLDAVTADDTGDVHKVFGPTAIFVESLGFGGGTVTIYARRTPTSVDIPLGSYTSVAVVNDSIIGEHYLVAVLAGSTNPDPVTVSTAGIP